MGDGDLSVFGSAPPPDKDDVLFRADEDWEANACVGSTVADWIYFTGFRRAAQRLAEHVCDTGNDQDFLIYPIVYLYRHHIELILKSIFESASGLLDRALTENDRKTLGRHGLLELWQAARPLLNPICDRADNPPFPAAELEGIDSYIRQIHEHDPDGQRFRYATIRTRAATRQGAKVPSLRPGLKLINVRVFADAMEKLVSYLEGIEWWFSDLEDAYAEVKRNRDGL
jgi:hypothetical protein